MFSGASGIVFEHPWTLNFRFCSVKFCYRRSTFIVGATSTLSQVAEVLTIKHNIRLSILLLLTPSSTFYPIIGLRIAAYRIALAVEYRVHVGVWNEL